MAGTRTAPVINDTPGRIRVSVGHIDAQGQERSVAIDMPSSVTNQEIEAYIAADQTISRSSVFRVEVVSVYEGAKSVSNAEDEEHSSVWDNIVLLEKSSLNDSENAFAPAPIDTVFVPDTNSPDTGNAVVLNWISAVELLLNGGAGGSGTYTGRSVRFTERRNINDSVKL